MPPLEPTPVSLPEYKHLIQDFLHATSFKLPPHETDPSFDAEVLTTCLAQDLPNPHMPSIASCGSSAAKYFFPSHPLPVQLSIAKFVSLTILVDDMGSSILSGLKTYRSQLLRGERISTKVIQALFDQIADMGQYYAAFAREMMFKGLVEYLAVNVLEMETRGVLRPSGNTPGFEPYLRQKSGTSESFTLLIFLADANADGLDKDKGEDVGMGEGKGKSEGEGRGKELSYLPILPELMRFADVVNDILSFYKESIIGNERDNAIYLHAMTHNQSILNSLKDFQKEAVVCLRRIYGFLDENEGGRYRGVVESFLMGYVAFHIMSERYRLVEVGICLDVDKLR